MTPDPNESAVLLRAVVDNSPDAIITIDAGGKICSANPAAGRLFGYADAELVGKNVKLLMPDHFGEQRDAYIGRYLATGERHILGRGRVVTGLHKDGSTFPAELFVGETFVGETRHFVGFVRDLSDLDREHRRVQELQSKLFHVSRLGEMGQLASALAHEVAQPLAAIMNYVQAVRAMPASNTEAAFPPSSAGIFEKIESQASRAVDIIKHLRTFVQRHESERDDCDLHALIEEALTLALIGSSGRGTHVQLVLMPGNPAVNVDRVQIQQVLVNLVRNGIDAMDGLPQRELTIATAFHDPNFVRVSVSDTGSGIAPEIAKELFDSFVTTKTQGLGIGLSISKRIVESHEGRIWCVPNEPVGTTFNFTVPLAEAARIDRENLQ